MNINWQELLTTVIEKTPLKELMDSGSRIIEEKREKRKAENIVRHGDALYITLKDDTNNTWYCAICYGNNEKLIPVDRSTPGSIYCPVCKHTSWYDRELSPENDDQQDWDLNKYLGYNGYNR